MSQQQQQQQQQLYQNSVQNYRKPLFAAYFGCSMD
jgi:hypothetical protein